MKTLCLMVISFGLGFILADFIKDQLAKLVKKNK
jgi:hypothetical protein